MHGFRRVSFDRILEPEAHGRVSIYDSSIADLTTLPPLILLHFRNPSFYLIECRTSLPESQPSSLLITLTPGPEFESGATVEKHSILHPCYI